MTDTSEALHTKPGVVLHRRSFLAWVGGVVAAALLGPVAAAKPKPPQALDVYDDTYSDIYGLRG